MHEIPPFRERLSTALADRGIHEGLADFQNRWRERRDEVIAGLETQTGTGFAELARKVSQAKSRARHDPAVLEMFREQAAARGIAVTDASTAEDACQIIADICARRGTRLVVKTKSMATEEIFLNEHLESQGITAVETDLGEWLLQCEQDRPSHLIVPAIHKRRTQIATLLTSMFDRPFDPEDIEGMARVVRAELRPHFTASGVGVTGGNILVAETGSLVLVTNEGNAGLTTTLPPVHIAVVGIDKMVESTSDALDVVRLLAKSATGQVVSSYTQFISGPTPAQPEAEMHVILLDNGRSQMAEDPMFDSALSCIRCGACANVCPPYQVVGGHAFGHVYTGAIGLVTTAFHHGIEAAAGPQSLCISCGACAQVCPANIPLPDQILEVRARSHSAKTKRGRAERSRELSKGLESKPNNIAKKPAKKSLAKTPVAMKIGLRVLRSRRMTAAAAWLAAITSSPFRTGNLLGRLPLRKKHNWRTPPAPAMRSARRRHELREVAAHNKFTSPKAAQHAKTARQFRKAASQNQKAGSQAKPTPSSKKTALFIQCVTDRFAPEIAVATLRLLQSTGADVEVPLAQHCCGLPAIDTGDLEAARKMAIATLDALEGYERVVTPAPSCAVAMAHEYVRLFQDDPSNQQRAQDLAAKVADLVSYLANCETPEKGNESTGEYGASAAPATSMPQSEKHSENDCGANGASVSEATNLEDAGTSKAKAPDAENSEAGTITVHPFCQSRTRLGHTTDTAAELISNLCGITPAPLPEADVCCGFGGSSSLTSPEIAKAILARKLQNAASAGATTLITDNPGCALHLRGGAHAVNQNLKVLHIAEFLAPPS